MANTNYSVGDFLIRLKNSALAGKKEVVVPKTNFIKAVGKALQDAKYIDEIKEDNGNLILKLSYVHKRPRLTDVKLVSKPGLRIYIGAIKLKQRKSASIYIISTPKGVFTSKQAILEGVGGEVIAEIL